MATEAFGGFRGGSRATVVPNAFFTLLLPEISDPAELIVSVYVFFVLSRKTGSPRSLAQSSLAAERPLIRALQRLPSGAAQALRVGVDSAIARGTLLVVGRRGDGDRLLALNTDSARQLAADRGLLADEPPSTDEPALLLSPQPNIFTLYEENVGSLPPVLLDELEEAERLYPLPWIQAAFREAAASNRRNWRYISRILERWKIEGPNYEASGGPASIGNGGRRRTVGGPYRRVIEGRGRGRG